MASAFFAPRSGGGGGSSSGVGAGAAAGGGDGDDGEGTVKGKRTAGPLPWVEK